MEQILELLENQIKTLKIMLSPEQRKVFQENAVLKREMQELRSQYQQNDENVADMIQQIMQRDERIFNMENQLGMANDVIEE